jgi:hypothetical protein
VGSLLSFSDHQNTDGAPSIFVMNIDGSGVTRLTNAGRPAWVRVALAQRAQTSRRTRIVLPPMALAMSSSL